MKFCGECAHPLDWVTPQGDNRPRHVCKQCGTIYYSNPRVIAGCLPIYEDKVMLCKRDIEPRRGYWTLPAGFMENGETTEQGALRETWEETRAEVEILCMYTHTSIVHVNQVQIIYLARLLKPEFQATEESSDVRLFKESEIPWDALAFSTVHNALTRYFEDRARDNRFPLYRCSIDRQREPETDIRSQTELSL